MKRQEMRGFESLDGLLWYYTIFECDGELNTGLKLADEQSRQIVTFSRRSLSGQASSKVNSRILVLRCFHLQ